MMKKFTVLLAILLSITCHSFGQKKDDRLDHKLLWRISGNGLTKPSYLFGTMHVQDNRAFQFSDSTILKILECEAFAMEVHPDSVSRFVVSVMLGEIEQNSNSSNKFRELLSTAEYNRLDSLMKKRMGVSLRTFKTPKQVQYFITGDLGKKDKETFLDAWLYRIARSQGKLMLGVEDYRAQLEVTKDGGLDEIKGIEQYLQSENANADNFFQSMLDLYYRGDIDAIRDFSIKHSSSDDYAKLIIDRNLIMAGNIAREVKLHSTFVAVGAAHLAGDEGIINLLKKEGYKVTPVTASFTGLASKYRAAKQEQTWITHESKQGGYSFELPGVPVAFTPPSLPISFQTYLDLSNMAFYMTTHMPIGPQFRNQPASKALDAMEERMKGNHKLHSSKDVKLAGYPGRQMELTLNGAYLKVVIVLREAVGYMMMIGPGKETVNSPDAQRFISSIKMLELPKQEATQLLRSEEGAFAVTVPGTVNSSRLTPMGPEGKKYKINMYYSSNSETGEAFILRYNDFPPGLISSHDSMYFAQTLAGIVSNMQGTDLSTEQILFNGFPCTKFSFYGQNKSALAEGRLFLRGERFYLLMNTRSPAGSGESARNFFDSFELLPYQSPPTKKAAFGDGITLTVPEKFESDSSITYLPDETQYAFTDASSGMVYILRVASFSKYDQAKDASEFFNERLKAQFEEEFIVESHGAVVGKNSPCYEYVLSAPGTNVRVQARTLLMGDKLATLYGYFPKDDTLSHLPRAVFESLDAKPNGTWSLFTDKVDVMLEDIASSDSLVRDEAKVTLEGYEFKKSDIQKIYKAVAKSYPDDSAWFGTRGYLMNAISAVADETTSSFIQKFYWTLPDTTTLKDMALGVLVGLKTETNVKAAIKIIQQDSSNRKFDGYFVLDQLRDSIQLFPNVALDLLAIESAFEDNYMVMSMVQNAMADSLLEGETKEKVIGSVMKIANERFANSPAELLDDKFEHALNILNAIVTFPPSADVVQLVRKFINHGHASLKSIGVDFLLDHNLPVESADVNFLAMLPAYRVSVYERLHQTNQLNLMDKEFATMKMLAEGCLYEYFESDEGYPDQMEFVSERSIMVAGKKQKLFVFKFKSDGIDTWWTAVAAPVVDKETFSRGDLTTVFYEEYKSKKLFDKALREYLAENDATLLH